MSNKSMEDCLSSVVALLIKLGMAVIAGDLVGQIVVHAYPQITEAPLYLMIAAMLWSIVVRPIKIG